MSPIYKQEVSHDHFSEFKMSQTAMIRKLLISLLYTSADQLTVSNRNFITT